MTFMDGLNKVYLIGWIVQAPEISHTRPSSVRFLVETRRTYRPAGWKGPPIQEKSLHDVVSYGPLADVAKKLREGDAVFIEGRLHTFSNIGTGEGTIRSCEVVALGIQYF